MLVLFFNIFFVLSNGVFAYDGQPQPLASQERPKEFQDIGITEKLGGVIDRSLPVINEKGESVTLEQITQGQPFLLSLVYFSCPSLCNLHLNGVFEGLKDMDTKPGKDFQVVALSFDEKENAKLALAKKENYLKQYGMSEKGIHFVTASAATIKRVSDETGFKFKWNEDIKEWAHASAAILVTKDFTISRYLHGVVFESKQLKLALLEAGRGKIGNIVDKVIWFCFRYDPHQSKYTLYAFRLVQLGGALMVLVLAAWLIPVWVRNRRAS
jgi:protein SCO1/2